MIRCQFVSAYILREVKIKKTIEMLIVKIECNKNGSGERNGKKLRQDKAHASIFRHTVTYNNKELIDKDSTLTMINAVRS
jgi:hypothetical protein